MPVNQCPECGYCFVYTGKSLAVYRFPDRCKNGNSPRLNVDRLLAMVNRQGLDAAHSGRGLLVPSVGGLFFDPYPIAIEHTPDRGAFGRANPEYRLAGIEHCWGTNDHGCTVHREV